VKKEEVRLYDFRWGAVKLLASSLVLLTSSFSLASPLDAVPWIGDGRPESSGADWYEEDPAPEFRATFVLPEGVDETKVHFACAGFGWFCIDGACMNSDGLDTLWSVYDKTVYAMTTRLVVGGKGEIRVFLGNGFYNLPPLNFWGSICFREALAHGRPCFKLSIDGVKEPLKWEWRKTNVVRSSVYLGTEIDATRPEDAEWKPAAVARGPKGRIVEWPRENPQMGCYDIHHGTVKKVERKSGGGESEWVQVVDFGINASGTCDFTFHGEARGTRVEIVYGERLNADGSVNVLTQTAGQIKKGNGGSGAPYLACQRDAYVCCGRDDRFRPPFTWHVCRYAEIRGAKNLVWHPTRYVRSMVSTKVGLASAAKDFKTDNVDLAKLHEVCQRTFQANLIGGVQSDCPGRERLGYGGDIVATCEALCLNFNMKEIYLKILRDFADDAADDGWITETSPFVGIADANGFESRSRDRAGPVSWAVVVPVLMETLMRHYPDAKDRALAFYPTCARYVRLMDAKHPSGIVPRCIGDHEALERAPNEVTATAHWHEFVRLTAKFAGMLGRGEDAAAFGAVERKVAKAFAEKFVTCGIVANGSQSAQSMALYLGLVPADQIAAAERRLVEAVEEKGCALTTGLFSTRYMLIYLAEHGRNDLARRVVLHKGFPGWLYMIERGATTLWETWKESDDVYSNCHPMFGSVDEWILRYGGKK